MNENTMELTVDELELANGGINLKKILKETAWGVGIGAAHGGMFGMFGGPVGLAIGAGIGAVVGGVGYTVAAVLDNK